MRPPFFICTSARSGSFFFMDLLNTSGKVQTVREHLWHAREIQTDEEMQFYWENIEVNQEEPWGTKVDVRDISTVERYLDIEQIAPSDIKWIRLRRRDKINQAISHCRMLRTGVQHLFGSDTDEEKNRAKSDMEIPVEELNQFALLYFFVDATWENFLDKHQITPYTLYYEDFIDESTWEPTIAGVLDFLEITYTLPLGVHHKQIKQSPNKVSVNYERFLDYNHGVYQGHKYERHFWCDTLSKLL